jgi:hypothetical protein
MPRLKGALAGVAGLLVLAAVSVLEAQRTSPLPDEQAFLAATRENLARSNRVQDEYAYKERRTELHTNPFGRLGTGDDLLFEVTPLSDGATGFTRRLVPGPSARGRWTT